MSTAATSSSSKDEKKKKNYTEPDRISELPDPILHHILSFLDIKYVIPTSVLARRWRFLWNSLPFLNINNEVYNVDCKYPRGYVDPNALQTDFTNFVHRVLLMRDGRSDLSSCCFSYYDDDSEFYVKRDERKKLFADIYFWILVIIRSNKVQVFDLRISSLSMPDQFDLPHCLFNSKYLTTLKLDVEPVEDVEPLQPKCNLPTQMNLPALRYLLLRSFSIVGDVGKLVSSCPVLETFIFSKCEVNLCGKQLNISGSQLNNLEIEDISDDSSETGSLEYCKVKVFAPKLTSFISRSAPMNDYTFVDSTSSLVNAEIQTDEYSWGYYIFDYGKESPERITWKQEFVLHLIKCFRAICNVRSLTLSAWLLTIITEAQAGFRSLPMDPFYNLRILNLKTSLWRNEVHGITWLLKKCPTLETLVLQIVEYDGYSHTAKKDDFGWEANLEPPCMMDHLKLVEIWDILISVYELEFLKFLLKNATILEKMIVHTPKEKPASDNIKLKRFCETLKTFPAASSMTKISFFLKEVMTSMFVYFLRINSVIPFVCPHCMMWSTECQTSVTKGVKLWKDFTSNEDGLDFKVYAICELYIGQMQNQGNMMQITCRTSTWRSWT